MRLVYLRKIHSKCIFFLLDSEELNACNKKHLSGRNETAKGTKTAALKAKDGARGWNLRIIDLSTPRYSQGQQWVGYIYSATAWITSWRSSYGFDYNKK